MDLDRALELARGGRDQAVADLCELLRIPSVSTDPAFGADVARAADWLAARLERIGMTVTVAPGTPHPVVCAEWMGRPGAPVLGIYSHYDVQPPDPLELWDGPPFEPVVRDGAVYARGARDDKGQLVAVLKAVEHALAAGGPPVNLRLFLEGEEEIAGPSLGRVLREQSERLRSDCVLIVDGQFAAPGVPTIVTVLRGVLLFGIEVRGPATDLHSGLYGGVAPNPINSLSHVVAALKDGDGRVQVPGFYDGVQEPTAAELAGWERLAGHEDELRAEVGARALEGEAGFSPLERLWARPTLDIHGISGGYVGEGIKAVIPARASAIGGMRLVPGQDPAAIFAALDSFVAGLASDGVEVEVRSLGQARPMSFATDSPGVAAVTGALRDAFGAEPLLGRLGGTIPVTADFADTVSDDVVVVGFGLPDDGNHAPNERFSLDQFHRATEALLRAMSRFAASAA
jgi:acetylornithine deacetylase/succinyl-diaminopimelate desuccinylase-like protein